MRDPKSPEVRALLTDPDIAARLRACYRPATPDGIDTPDACWQWLGARTCADKGREPTFRIGMTTFLGACAVWAIERGEFLLAGRLRPVCRTPDCVRPSHQTFTVTGPTEQRALQRHGTLIIRRSDVAPADAPPMRKRRAAARLAPRPSRAAVPVPAPAPAPVSLPVASGDRGCPSVLLADGTRMVVAVAVPMRSGGVALVTPWGSYNGDTAALALAAALASVVAVSEAA